MAEESTTPDLVELLRHLADAANAQDFDTAFSYYADDAVWDTSRTLGQGIGVFEGAVRIRRFLEDWRRGYAELEFVFEELLDVGNGLVFALVRQAGRPVGATGLVRQREGWIYIWVDGLIASVTVYPEADIDEGRAAAERLAEERE
jgi:ketosteroid isomerase-like protein